MDVNPQDLAKLREDAEAFVFGETVSEGGVHVDKYGREVYSSGTKQASIDVDAKERSVLVVMVDRQKFIPSSEEPLSTELETW